MWCCVVDDVYFVMVLLWIYGVWGDDEDVCDVLDVRGCGKECVLCWCVLNEWRMGKFDGLCVWEWVIDVDEWCVWERFEWVVEMKMCDVGVDWGECVWWRDVLMMGEGVWITRGAGSRAR